MSYIGYSYCDFILCCVISLSLFAEMAVTTTPAALQFFPQTPKPQKQSQLNCNINKIFAIFQRQ
jgi:hypothetical protein